MSEQRKAPDGLVTKLLTTVREFGYPDATYEEVRIAAEWALNDADSEDALGMLVRTLLEQAKAI
jgi:hypothetical protein